MTDLSTIDGRARGPRRGLGVRALRRGGTRLRLSLAAGLRIDEPVTLALAATVGLSIYFMALPGVDLAISALFFGPEGFALAQNPVLKVLRKSSSWVMGAMIVALIVVLARAARGGARIDARRAGVLLAGLALGSGLVVNGLLKSLWGRARPVQVEGFGGEADFTAAWTVSDQCLRNCSFVSGEASSAAWMVAVVALMAPAAMRPWALPAILAYGGALSINRMAFGGHFLSDVLLSWAITALVLAALHRLTLACPQAARRLRRARRAQAAG